MLNISGEIKALKKELGSSVVVMGHHYQTDEVAEHCDIMGDSLELARKIEAIQAENIVFCGVYFMGETAVLLAKEDQKIFLPEPDADCMMSLMASAKLCRNVMKDLSSTGRKIIPLAYVNTMLELKDVVGEYGGAVCTSANAQKMLRWAFEQGDAVLFLPDKHLGRNTAKKLGVSEDDQHILRLRGKGLMPDQPEAMKARLLLWPGSCAVHAKLSPVIVENIKKERPGAAVIAHPECKPELIEKCDGAGSTSYLINEAERIARDLPGSELIIGTEENLVSRLAARHAGKIKISPLGRAFCPHMSKVTGKKLLATLQGVKSRAARPIAIDPKIAASARSAVQRMLDVCGK